MFRITSLIVALGLAWPVVAQETAPEGSDVTPLFRDAAGVDLEAFRWTTRPVIVFADSAEDPAFQRQIALLTAGEEELRDRDIIVFTDTDPAGNSDIRLKLRPRGFMMALIGKDGGVKLRKPLPWDVRELTRVIDKMPMRQQEVRDRRAVNN